LASASKAQTAKLKETSMKHLPGTFALVTILAGPAMAQSLPVAPGNWEMSATYEQTINGEGDGAQENVFTQCIPQDEAVIALGDIYGSDCTITTTSQTPTSIAYDLNCDMYGVLMTGTGTFETTNDAQAVTVSADISHLDEVNGELRMRMNASAEHIGECE
tara:strand:+ start:58882 stop:59364 length:483 start_codon:yes stop_codon:yes gene_type:complete